MKNEFHCSEIDKRINNIIIWTQEVKGSGNGTWILFFIFLSFWPLYCAAVALKSAGFFKKIKILKGKLNVN